MSSKAMQRSYVEEAVGPLIPGHGQKQSPRDYRNHLTKQHWHVLCTPCRYEGNGACPVAGLTIEYGRHASFRAWIEGSVRTAGISAASLYPQHQGLHKGSAFVDQVFDE